MAIPDFQSIMLPLLKLTSDGGEHSLRGSIESLAEQFRLTREERKTLLPSGTQGLFDNRVAWARTYLKQAGLLESSRRGCVRITPRGRELLESNPKSITSKFLRRYPEFQAFQTRSRRSTDLKPVTVEPEKPPREAMDEIHQAMREELAQDLLKLISECSPVFFERLVVALLVKMGYGGSLKDAGEALGQSGDEGLDGIIREDRLGLEVIYLQAKRWQGPVGRPEIQKFVGALHGKHARKGVFITTSAFTQDARSYVAALDSKVVLVDGRELAQLMIDYDLGVSTTGSYAIKRVDTDFFTED
jgi:restriction system protein